MRRFLALSVLLVQVLSAQHATLHLQQTASAGKVGPDVQIFMDRPYLLKEYPDTLKGLLLIHGSIEAPLSFSVAQAGMLSILTAAPENNVPWSQAQALLSAGFQEASTNRYQLFGTGKADRVACYQKHVSPGDTFTFNRWVVVVAKQIKNPDGKEAVISNNAADLLGAKMMNPDYIVFIPKGDRAVRGDRYNDHFQVFDKTKDMLFATWTQATREGDIDQHICFTRSVDHGKTWEEPIVLAGSANYVNPQPIASWQQPMVSKTGRIYILWNQRISNEPLHHGIMVGKYSDDDGATWSQPRVVPLPPSWRNATNALPNWCIWQRPLRLGKDNRYIAGLSRHGVNPKTQKFGTSVEIIQYENIDDNPAVEDIRITCLNPNERELLVTDPKFGECAEEASLVKLPDNSLFALMRTSAGSPYWAQSRDFGATWTTPKPLKDATGKPYLHPRAPCPIYDRAGPEACSGEYFTFVSNAERSEKSAHAPRGQLYLITGKFDPDGEQPIRFTTLKAFPSRKDGNAFYTSLTRTDNKTVLWIPDWKHYLVGKIIGDDWFQPGYPRLIASPADLKARIPGQLYSSKPDFVVFVPEVTDASVSDTGNEHFLVFDGPDGSLMAIWTQSSAEGQPDHHITFTQSKDEGKSWSKPRVIAGPRVPGECPIASWAYPLVSTKGRIYVLYSQYIGKHDPVAQHAGELHGIYSDDNGVTWSNPQNIPQLKRSIHDSPDATIPPNVLCWQKPLRLGKDNTYLAGITRWSSTKAKPPFGKSWTGWDSRVEFMRFENIDDSPEPKDIRISWFAFNDAALAVPSPESDTVSVCQEPTLVKLPDGRLFCTLRTYAGSPFWSISSDLGETWSTPKRLLYKDHGEAIKHPLSPCPMYDLGGSAAASGHYVLFVHNNDGNYKGFKPYQTGDIRQPIYLLRGTYQANAEQPIWFDQPERFMEHDNTSLGRVGTQGRIDMSLYSSFTVRNNIPVLWYPDRKFFLLGKIIESQKK